MEKSLIIFIVLFVTFLIISIYLKLSLNKFNDTFKGALNKNQENVNNLFKFSYDIHFNPPKDTINITNPYECTPVDLQKCTLDDPFSCIGCKSLISTCTHIEKDTKYIDANGVEHIIPKNDSVEEGYCLTKTNPSQSCNPYHGDLVFVQLDADAKESLLYCECKNPGFIGKTTIDGACDEVFICDGDIDDINQPLENINCNCKNNSIPQTINNIPTCVNPNVGEFTYNDKYFFNDETINSSYFIDDISNFYSGDFIINPCKKCLITGAFVDGDLVESDDGWQCVIKNSKSRGLAIRRDPKYRILKGTNGPDAVIDVKISKLYIHGYLYDTTFEQMTAVLETSYNIDILKFIGANITDRFTYLNLKNHQLVFPQSFGAMEIDKFPGIMCSGIQIPGWIDDFSYSCDFTNSIDIDRKPKGFPSYTTLYSSNPNISFDTAPNCPPKHHSIITGGVFKGWKQYEGFNSAHYKTTINKLIKYQITQGFKDSGDIKYIFSIFDFDNQTSVHYGTTDHTEYMKWYVTLIPIANP